MRTSAWHQRDRIDRATVCASAACLRVILTRYRHIRDLLAPHGCPVRYLMSPRNHLSDNDMPGQFQNGIYGTLMH